MAERNKKSNMVDEDLISRLPDEILTHILSYVNTNSAVATSILSKRWQLVWTLVPNLEFERSSSHFDRNKRVACLENLVDRVLSLNNVASVRKVKLDCRGCDDLRVTAWCKSLVMRSAEKFNLTFSSLTKLDLLPDYRFFNQKNLVKLKLYNVVVEVPPLVCFPCLKTIKLIQVELFDDESMKNLLSGCPTITDLCILIQKSSDGQTLYVCSSTLQNLQVKSSTEIVIDAPKVRYLRLRDQQDASYGLINLPSLVEASLINVNDNEFLYELFGKISHVKELVLDENTTRALSRSPPERIAMLHKLTHLTLSGIESPQKLALLLCLLPYTPNGVNIIFKLVNGHPHCCWYEPLNLPQSIISCIESVKIAEKDDSSVRKWMSVITCILKDATGSKKMTFHGFPIEDIHVDKFLKTFLPVSNESKKNKAFVPSS